MLRKQMGIGIAAFLLAGCALAVPPISLEATPADIIALTGEWQGEYRSSGTGRHGSIRFSLDAAGGAAVGEVLMVPAGYAPVRVTEGAEYLRRPIPQILFVTFVHAESGTYTGRLAEYRDPECGCPLTTVFTGRLATPDEIIGTFVTTGPSAHDTQAGEWSVRRVRSAR